MAGYSITAGNQILDYINTNVYNGGTGSNATIEFLDNSSNVLCVVNLNSPPFNSASNKAMTLNNSTQVTGVILQSGTPVKARIKNKSGTVIRDDFTVGVGTQYNFNCSSVDWQQNGVVIINSFNVNIQ